MASIKSSRTWADIQESLSRVRQQYGLLPRAEWDDLIAVTSYEKAMSAKHKNRSLPRPFLPSLTSKSNWDLRKLDLEYVDTKRRKQHEGRRSAKYDSSYHKPLLLKNNEHERTKPTLEHNAYRYITENKRFAQDFVDSLISEILMDEIIPDVLIEALTSTQMSKKKYNGKKTRHWKSDDYGRSAGSLSMSILDELLIEILRDLSAHVLRRMVRGFVDDHLVRAAVHDCVDEILTNIIQTELLSLIIVTANKHVVDIFLLEHLLGMIGTHEPLVFGKDPMQCLLDSIMLDVLLREQVSIQQVQQNTLETYPAMLSHQNTVSKVALEVILTELHMILVEDMEDIFEYERDVEL
ncbi:uncharacterized protein LOC130294081 isoform X2 [Hyla sarda]|uniref:uncharacterized protein LOC130294081 isoform X2 n=1 Tax=Hyla sarda TaxID=327740 RepID=UPI0024C27FC1|nr:uncharacterized protein LOC130294081 isoform X2 [Hyla sarda]